MRDVNRIDAILQRIAVVWKKNPDLRLAQLFDIVQNRYSEDIFYLEDEQFADLLEQAMSTT